MKAGKGRGAEIDSAYQYISSIKSAMNKEVGGQREVQVNQSWLKSQFDGWKRERLEAVGTSGGASATAPKERFLRCTFSTIAAGTLGGLEQRFWPSLVGSSRSCIYDWFASERVYYRIFQPAHMLHVGRPAVVSQGRQDVRSAGVDASGSAGGRVV